MTALQQKGFKIIDPVNIIKKEKKEDKQDNRVISRNGLPLFMVTFDRKEKAERVYTRSILNMKVTTEPLWKTSELIMQCKSCLLYTSRCV